jgi:hypothetical protein
MPIHKDIQAYYAAQSAGDKRICDALAKGNRSTPAERPEQGLARAPGVVWFLDSWTKNPIVGTSKLKDCIRLLFWSGQSFDEPKYHAIELGVRNE